MNELFLTMRAELQRRNYKANSIRACVLALLERGEVAPAYLEERKINSALHLSPQVRQALAEAGKLQSRTSE